MLRKRNALRNQKLSPRNAGKQLLARGTFER
eukprot:CAMPEP_0204377674 /NCGR_PEP_ID=MMETSP0469-20131031/51134_1 /ASSEMBLY_ACC=CAM_ASM_000384 /TAXON_ID=2969 /ORGANISM="Oxyrrhis marina" /LENGTH=30 /DNA_ID= /DNA_START= /DNA_END= /DNA_ORIENTATION=